MLCREEIMTTNLLDTNKVYPVVDINGSDSAMLDNTLEFLVMSGMELPRAVTVSYTHLNSERIFESCSIMACGRTISGNRLSGY